MVRLDLYHRDGRRIRHLAVEIELQVGYFERNVAGGDEAEAMRFLLIQNLASDLLRAATRGANRYWKTRAL